MNRMIQAMRLPTRPTWLCLLAGLFCLLGVEAWGQSAAGTIAFGTGTQIKVTLNGISGSAEIYQISTESTIQGYSSTSYFLIRQNGERLKTNDGRSVYIVSGTGDIYADSGVPFWGDTKLGTCPVRDISRPNFSESCVIGTVEFSATQVETNLLRTCWACPIVTGFMTAARAVANSLFSTQTTVLDSQGNPSGGQAPFSTIILNFAVALFGLVTLLNIVKIFNPLGPSEDYQKAFGRIFKQFILLAIIAAFYGSVQRPNVFGDWFFNPVVSASVETALRLYNTAQDGIRVNDQAVNPASRVVLSNVGSEQYCTSTAPENRVACMISTGQTVLSKGLTLGLWLMVNTGQTPSIWDSLTWISPLIKVISGIIYIVVFLILLLIFPLYFITTTLILSVCLVFAVLLIPFYIFETVQPTFHKLLRLIIKSGLTYIFIAIIFSIGIVLINFVAHTAASQQNVTDIYTLAAFTDAVSNNTVAFSYMQGAYYMILVVAIITIKSCGMGDNLAGIFTDVSGPADQSSNFASVLGANMASKASGSVATAAKVGLTAATGGTGAVVGAIAGGAGALAKGQLLGAAKGAVSGAATGWQRGAALVGGGGGRSSGGGASSPSAQTPPPAATPASSAPAPGSSNTGSGSTGGSGGSQNAPASSGRP